MRTQFLALLLAVVSSLLLSCSVNAPTPSSQITASPVSDLKYADYSCASLTAALESLARRNLDLIRAQEQRIKSSEVQGTILGVGQGDGAEAFELSQVRGEQAAAAKVFNAKRCEYNR
ncbi:MAG: hypothetical protein ABI547_11875 [Betaproteobacteria bacterium]